MLFILFLLIPSVVFPLTTSYTGTLIIPNTTLSNCLITGATLTVTSTSTFEINNCEITNSVINTLNNPVYFKISNSNITSSTVNTNSPLLNVFSSNKYGTTSWTYNTMVVNFTTSSGIINLNGATTTHLNCTFVSGGTLINYNVNGMWAIYYSSIMGTTISQSISSVLTLNIYWSNLLSVLLGTVSILNIYDSQLTSTSTVSTAQYYERVKIFTSSTLNANGAGTIVMKGITTSTGSLNNWSGFSSLSASNGSPCLLTGTINLSGTNTYYNFCTLTSLTQTHITIGNLFINDSTITSSATITYTSGLTTLIYRTPITSSSITSTVLSIYSSTPLTSSTFIGVTLLFSSINFVTTSTITATGGSILMNAVTTSAGSVNNWSFSTLTVSSPCTLTGIINISGTNTYYLFCSLVALTETHLVTGNLFINDSSITSSTTITHTSGLTTLMYRTSILSSSITSTTLTIYSSLSLTSSTFIGVTLSFYNDNFVTASTITALTPSGNVLMNTVTTSLGSTNGWTFQTGLIYFSTLRGTINLNGLSGRTLYISNSTISSASILQGTGGLTTTITSTNTFSSTLSQDYLFSYYSNLTSSMCTGINLYFELNTFLVASTITTIGSSGTITMNTINVPLGTTNTWNYISGVLNFYSSIIRGTMNLVGSQGTFINSQISNNIINVTPSPIPSILYFNGSQITSTTIAQTTLTGLTVGFFSSTLTSTGFSGISTLLLINSVSTTNQTINLPNGNIIMNNFVIPMSVSVAWTYLTLFNQNCNHQNVILNLNGQMTTFFMCYLSGDTINYTPPISNSILNFNYSTIISSNVLQLPSVLSVLSVLSETSILTTTTFTQNTFFGYNSPITSCNFNGVNQLFYNCQMYTSNTIIGTGTTTLNSVTVPNTASIFITTSNIYIVNSFLNSITTQLRAINALVENTLIT